MGHCMRKPEIYICENKGSDQLRCENKGSDRLHGTRKADQRLCFPYTNSKIPLLSKSEISSFLAIFCRCTARFESDLVGNPDCWFCQTKAQISL